MWAKKGQKRRQMISRLVSILSLMYAHENNIWMESCVTDYEWNNEGGHKDFIKAGVYKIRKLWMGSLLMAVNFVLQYCEGSQFLKQLVYRATLPFTIRSKIFICTSCLNQISILDVFLTFVLNNKLFSVKATKYRNSNLGYDLALKI